LGGHNAEPLVGGGQRGTSISRFPDVSQFTVPYRDIAAAVVVTVAVMVLALLFQRRIVPA
jgi:hypothetical protein